MSEGTERISVSRDALRAELNELKVDLIDRINHSLSTKADEAVVQEHDKRITQLEISQAGRAQMPDQILELNSRLDALEKFRWSVPSIALISVMLLVYYYVLK
jgi:hypothetical protein